MNFASLTAKEITSEDGAIFSALDDFAIDGGYQDHPQESDEPSKDDGILWSPSYEQAKNELIKRGKLEPLHIEAKDIPGLVLQARTAIVKEGLDYYYIYPVIWVDDPRELIKAGFIPTSVNLNSKALADYVDGYDLKTLEYWWPNDPLINTLKDLNYSSRWVYTTIKKWRSVSDDRCIALPFKYHYPDMLYSSNRPINNMETYRSPLNKTVTKVEDMMIPVTRYGAGMSKGKYHNSTVGTYLGTFYYKEPESKTFLAYGKAFTSFNKYTALKSLLVEYRLKNNDDKYAVLESYYDDGGHYTMKKWIKGKIPHDLMMTPLEAAEHICLTEEELEHVKQLPNEKYYAANLLMLYACEDELDQSLAIVARELGYDIVVLKNMAGAFQVVEEILDVRDRMTSFDNLVYLV